MEILIQYVTSNNRVPPSDFVQSGCNIGYFWSNVKQGKHKTLYESILSTNPILRADMDRVVLLRDLKSQTVSLTPEQKGQYLLMYVNREGRVPTESCVDFGFNIGTFWGNIKQGNHKLYYQSVLSSNSILREDMERLLERRKRKADEISEKNHMYTISTQGFAFVHNHETTTKSVHTFT